MNLNSMIGLLFTPARISHDIRKATRSYYDRSTAAFLTVALAAIILCFFYKSSVPDPIADIKKTYVIFQLSAIGGIIFFTILSSYISRTPKSLLIKLIIIFLFSIASFMLILVNKANLDMKYYDRGFFAQVYDEMSREDYIEMTRKINETHPNGVKSYFNIYMKDSMFTYGLFILRTLIYLRYSFMACIYDIFKSCKGE